jgi:hypothetical protein
MKTPAVMLALLLFAATVFGQGTTVYILRTVTAGPGDIRVGDILRTTAAPLPSATEALARSLAPVGDKILYVPSSLSTGLIAEAYGSDSIIVGSGTLVLPRGVLPEGEDYLMDRLGDFLCGQGLVGDGIAEITVLQNLVRRSLPRQGIPTFQVMRTSKGACEITFTLGAGEGGSVSGRVSLPAGDAVKDQRIGAGTSVNVIFRRGLVTIEMPGKALAMARVGERVSVSIAESRKSFSGRLLDGKAVEVELP